MNLRRLLCSAALAALPALAGDQFTFKIPYDAKKLLPSATALEFHAAVFITKPGESDQWWVTAVGHTTKEVSLSPDGAASGTLSLGVNVKAGQSPAEVKYYRCWVSLKGPAGAWGLTPQGGQGYDKLKTDQKAAPGTPLKMVEEGWLPGKGPK